jgi:hypothetical protein
VSLPRQDYIMPTNAIDPIMVARALRRIADVMDATDEAKHITLNSCLDENVSPNACHDAWSVAAFLIADMTDALSSSLRKLANDMNPGSQRALFE